MMTPNRFLTFAVAFLTGAAAWGQAAPDENFALKARADIGIGNAMGTSTSLSGLSTKSSANEFGIDFGWTFWRKGDHSLEANIGLAYNALSAKSNIGNLKYAYEAPATADMDGDPYVRHYDIPYLSQKVTLGGLMVPLYLDYSYRCNEWLGLHADLGFKFGFRVASSLGSASGKGSSYGVYPEYDDLMIDAPYLNDFGEGEYTKAMTDAPTATSFTCGLMVGVGAEFRIAGPLAAAVDFRYDCTFNSLYKRSVKDFSTVTANNAPVTYLVSEGTRVKALNDYLKHTRFSLPGIQLSIIYRF